MGSTVYQFDVFSSTYYLGTNGTWNSGEEGYYYAIIPLEVGKAYKITLQNVTTLARFRVAQADSNVIGTPDLLMVGYNDTPTYGFSLEFKAIKNYLICYGGTANGGEVALSLYDGVDLEGTTWNIPNGWYAQSGYGKFYVDGSVTLISNGEVYEFTSLNIGYTTTSGKEPSGLKNGIALDNNVWFSNSSNLLISINSGLDTINHSLFSWLDTYGELQEPEEPEEPEPTATVITYNGSTIATLEAGQTATIKTAETEVEHDIIITPVFPIEIAYGDIIATAEAGQTATVKCANTEADFDIVVSAKAEEDDSAVGTWVFNETVEGYYGSFLIYMNYRSTTDICAIKFKDGTTFGFYFNTAHGGFDGYLGMDSYNPPNQFYARQDSIKKTFYLSEVESIKIPNENVIVSDGFYNWLKANATKQ